MYFTTSTTYLYSQKCINDGAQSKQAEDLTEKDRELQEQDRELRTQLALHRDIVKEMEKKLAAYRKTVQSLTEQLDLKVTTTTMMMMACVSV